MSSATADILEISVQNAARAREVRAKELHAWLARLLADVAPEARSFTLRCTSDREMRDLNRRFRGKDKPTDVLSFPGELSSGEDGDTHLGDVVIAMPTARRQAREADHAVERELRLLALNGVLHCLGHDHETDDGTMERLEQRLRRRWLDDATESVRGA